MNKPQRCRQHPSAHRAGCEDCRRHARENYRYYRPTHLADRTLHSVEPVRAHVRTLRDAGMRTVDIAADSGTSPGHLNRIVYGKTTTHCMTGTARRILAVRPRPCDVQNIDGVGVRRRIQALACIGWSQADVAQRAGYNESVGSNWANAARVLQGTRNTVAAIYDELSTIDGPTPRAAVAARRRGWHPPEAWSDATIDDPQAEPYDWCRDDVDEVAVEQVEQGVRRWSELTNAEQRELVRRHVGTVRPSTLAHRWNTSRGRIEKFVSELADSAVAA
jgi:hypothetical protein